jgi:hypothetical protein
VYVLPRAASAITLPADVRLDGTTRAEIPATNAAPQPGRVEMFIPIGDDDREGNVPAELDIDWVGGRVTRDPQGERVIEFLVHTRAPRLTPIQAATWVALDTDKNGSMDWVVFTEDAGLWPWHPLRTPNGNQIAVATQIVQPSPLQISGNPSVYRADYFAGVDLQSRAAILPVRASTLGFRDNEPIEMNVSAMISSSFEDEPNGSVHLDAAPDGSWTTRGLSGARPWLFSDASLGYTPSPMSFNVPAGGSFNLRITFPSEAEGALPPLLAYFPMNGPDASRTGDLTVLTLTRNTEPTPPTPGPSIYLPALRKGG